MANINIPRPEHPNPQWERKKWVNLNGEWLFEIDHGASGEQRGLQNADTLSDRIIVPFCPESKLSGVEYTDFMLRVWYKKTITVSESDLDGNRIIFHIGAADFETKVWVNGVLAGLPHYGGYTSFEYDITKLLKVGDNLITISCYDDTRSPMKPRGKQSEEFVSRGCDYTRNTGIWQTVWYEIVPENYLKYAKIMPDLASASVFIDAELCGVARTAVFSVKVESAGESACLDDLVHTHRGLVNIVGELVGIPAEEIVSLVSVNRAEHSVNSRNAQVVLEGVSCECCVVCLDIHLEILIETVLANESDRGCRVEIVLMLHRLLRLGLDVKITGKSDRSAVFYRHSHKARDVFFFKFNVGIEESFVSFSAAPENVSLSAELDGQR